ncbi:MAG TPA: CopD family protein [Candidatus Dormibacteraeota bacterium]|nr:CopD family protein [Candidatus Dormibacteraeota bacterium]
MHVAFGAAFLGGLGLFIGDPDLAVAVRVACEGAAWLLCVRGNMYVAPFGVLAAALLAISGHATGAGAQFADALHVLSAGMWAGGILALATLRPPDGWRSVEAKTLLERFGRVALIAFGITALTGSLRATEQLHGLSDLWTTAYGIVLALKTAGVVVMLGLSMMWRRGFSVSRFEALAAVLVAGATALLASLPVQA